MRQPKIWLGLITQNEEKNIEELTSIAHYFDGIAATLHFPCNDKTLDILESRKGDGFVTQRPYPNNHGHSKNEWLFNNKIKLNDWILVLDSSERVNEGFAKNIRNFTKQLDQNGIGSLYQYSKLFMFKRFFNQNFSGGLHWGLQNPKPGYLQIDKVPGFENPKNYFYSTRNENRPKTHRYYHELKYCVSEAAINCNHIDLFWKDPNELRWHQEQLAEYLQMLEDVGVINADQWIEYYKNNLLTDEMTQKLNNERPFRNSYRFYVLNHTDEAILKDEDSYRITKADQEYHAQMLINRKLMKKYDGALKNLS